MVRKSGLHDVVAKKDIQKSHEIAIKTSWLQSDLFCINYNIVQTKFLLTALVLFKK